MSASTTTTAAVASSALTTVADYKAASNRSYYDRSNKPSFAGLSKGDKVKIWSDGAINPWIGTVDGADDAKGYAVVVGPRGGERGYVRNVHSGAWYAIVGTVSTLIARVEKI